MEIDDIEDDLLALPLTELPQLSPTIPNADVDPGLDQSVDQVKEVSKKAIQNLEAPKTQFVFSEENSPLKGRVTLEKDNKVSSDAAYAAGQKLSQPAEIPPTPNSIFDLAKEPFGQNPNSLEKQEAAPVDLSPVLDALPDAEKIRVEEKSIELCEGVADIVKEMREENTKEPKPQQYQRLHVLLMNLMKEYRSVFTQLRMDQAHSKTRREQKLIEKGKEKGGIIRSDIYPSMLSLGMIFLSVVAGLKASSVSQARPDIRDNIKAISELIIKTESPLSAFLRAFFQSPMGRTEAELQKILASLQNNSGEDKLQEFFCNINVTIVAILRDVAAHVR